MITLFNKKLTYKNYDCSNNPNSFNPRPPMFNLYIQVTDFCNATCQFCDKTFCTPNDQPLNESKLINILTELSNKNILTKISLTGGEPLLNINKLNSILNIIHTINPQIHITLNTNGSKLENFNLINHQYLINEIDISRHHYDQSKNNNTLNIKTTTLKEIQNFSNTHKYLNVKLNCVMSNNLINSTSEIETYLETIATHNIKDVKFISLLNLTSNYENLYFDIIPLINYFHKYTNIGNLYDKDICQCFEFIYISTSGFPIKTTIRNNKKATCNYLRQFVYTPNNFLLNGFNGQIII